MRQKRNQLIKQKLSVVGDSLDKIINYTDLSYNPEVQLYYAYFCVFRKITVKRQHEHRT
jgi:hypothetical protein